MNLKKLHKSFQNCRCERMHNCPIDDIVIGENALASLVNACSGFNSILLVSDQNTYSVCGERVFNLLSAKVEENLIFQTGNDVLIPNEKAIEIAQSKISNKTDLIIGVGSGVINDLCKYVSFFNKLPYFIVATAPSMDGYASVGAAMILKGMKETVNARPPKAIFADSAVIKNAPIDMLKAGYGDIVGKFSCLNDWKLSAFVNNEYFCEDIYNQTLRCAMDIKDKAKQILARDESAVSALMEALVLVGVMMSFAGSSRPASGSEHHLSHFFEITGILSGKEYLPHGIDVLCSAYYTQKIREELLKIDKPALNCATALSECEGELKEIYSAISDNVIALQKKLGLYDKCSVEFYFNNWERIKEILATSPSSEQIKHYIDEIELSLEEFDSLYGKEKINKALMFAKDLKDRYTVLWLNFMLNYKKESE